MKFAHVRSVSDPSIEQGNKQPDAASKLTSPEIGRAEQGTEAEQKGWRKWWLASREVAPVYVAVHLAAFVTTCLAVLFVHRDFDWSSSPLSTLWQSWNRWDTGHFISIATQGYAEVVKTAFFPLYPLLMCGLMFLVHSPLIAGLIISNVAGFVALAVLYQLVREDFDHERAARAVLYVALFPTAFFLMAAYNEALFLCLSLLSFYQMRHGRWWLAGLCGLLASLTRSAGLFLLVPFCYEYLRQHQFLLRKIRLDVVSGGLIPVGIFVFGVYCYVRFGDFLAFSHVQADWHRHLAPPWYGMVSSVQIIRRSGGLLGFYALRNLLDLLPDLFILVLLMLGFVGPWRLPRALWAYGFYAVVLYLFGLLVPAADVTKFPLQSTARFMIEVFPAFIVLAGMGKARMLHIHYLLVAGSIGFFLLTQFLTGHWIV